MRPKEKDAKKSGKKASKSSTVRSRVSEVRKGGQRVSRSVVAKMTTSSGAEEEIRDLVTPTKAKKKGSMAKSISGKLQKAKSAVGLNGRHARLQETPSAKKSPVKAGRSPAKVGFITFSPKNFLVKISPSLKLSYLESRRRAHLFSVRTPSYSR